MITAFQAAVASVDPAVLSGRAKAALAIDVSAEVSRAQVPMLYIRATRDALIREAIIDELRALNPRVESVEVDAPHLVLQLAPDESAAAIAAFIGRHVG